MSTSIRFTVLVLMLLARATSPAMAQERERAVAIEHEVQRIARETALWPEFDPASTPLAIFTGEHTYLFRHPAPPEGFVRDTAASMTVHAYRGRHPAVTSNSSARIGEVVTATLLADGRRAFASPTALAAVAMHEAFHVFQRAHHPGWQGNEGALLLYPFGDARVLALRRMESEALRRALTTPDTTLAACWARQAMAVRANRFALMDSSFVAYERASELNEGLASYVQLRAGGRVVDSIPATGFAATAVRHRVYAIGPVIGALLDRFGPGWKTVISRADTVWLDDVFTQTLGPTQSGPSRCEWTPAERDRMTRTAEADAAGVAEARTAERRSFDAMPGGRLIVRAAPGHPLQLDGFDPLNVHLIDGGVLHSRFLSLKNRAAEVRVIDEGSADLSSVTAGAGAHPLFNGVREVTVAGVGTPDVSRDDAAGTTTMRAPGLLIRVRGASVARNGDTLIVTLGSGSPK